MFNAVAHAFMGLTMFWLTLQLEFILSATGLPFDLSSRPEFLVASVLVYVFYGFACLLGLLSCWGFSRQIKKRVSKPRGPSAA